MAQDTLTRPLTKADFAAFMAGEPEGRFEFEDGRIIDMTGGTRNHSAIGGRFFAEIDRQIDAERWMTHGPDRGVEADDVVRYPDVVVDRNTDDGTSRWTQAPVLAVEVLSPSSEKNDLGRKADEYTGFPSLEAYIVAEPDQPTCYVWVRDADGEFPADYVEISGAGGVITVPALGLTIALSQVYRHILRRP